MSENLTDGDNAFSSVIGDREHQHDDHTGPILVHAATTHVS